jgi:uncharacterized protein (TIGR02266 family)
MATPAIGTTFIPDFDEETPVTDRRAFPRLELHAEVTFESDNNFYTGLTQDISSGGIFLATRALRPVGEQIKVTLTIPGMGMPLELDAEVRWVRDWSSARDADLPIGMGLKFLALSRYAQEVIGAFLRERDSLYFDDEP